MRMMAWLTWLALLPGCSPGPGDITGTVKYQGKPLTSGTVTITGSDGVAFGGEIKPDGTYTVSGVRSGTVQIAVSNKLNSRGGRVSDGGTSAAPPGWFEIPTKYANPATSELSTTIKAGPNTYDIDLK